VLGRGRVSALPMMGAARAAPVAPPRAAFAGDAILVAALVEGRPEAAAELYGRYAALVDRTLARILGADQELEDLRHDVFIRALDSIGDLREPEALGGWVRSIAVFVARKTIEKRTRRRRWTAWLVGDDPLDVAAPDDEGEPRDEARAALRAVYQVLERMPTEERMVFALRLLDGCELTEVAHQMAISPATVKRRFRRAVERFEVLARAHPVLATWVEGGVPCTPTDP
jgi:RNA polymerase sigma-70 factor (ECF subfamily)